MRSSHDNMSTKTYLYTSSIVTPANVVILCMLQLLYNYQNMQEPGLPCTYCMYLVLVSIILLVIWWISWYLKNKHKHSYAVFILMLSMS